MPGKTGLRFAGSYLLLVFVRFPTGRFLLGQPGTLPNFFKDRTDMEIFSFSPFGYEGAIVTVEVDLRRGIPGVDMVGLADGAVRESRERMRSALLNSGFQFPPERIVISLSPADLKKEGAGFDLAIALAVLAESAGESALPQGRCLVMGELELSGRVRPVRGVNAAAATARQQGIGCCIVPESNAKEAASVEGMTVFAATDLKQAFGGLVSYNAWKDSQLAVQEEGPADQIEFTALSPEFDMGDVRGQPQLVRGLQIAAAGGHNLLAFGPPGCGKTLALQKIPSLLPLLTWQEAQPVTRIYSLTGLLPPNQSLIREPPFRMPHQSASLEGMVGGGYHCRPGEISLAHNGVLFLDEASEFKSSVLQALRVPMETGLVTLTRAGRSTCYPCRFQLLVATNPCPCGNFGVPGKMCLCSVKSVEQFWRKFSAPLLDRMDIRIPVLVPDTGDGEYKTSRQLRPAIKQAVAVQRQRQGKPNAQLLPEEITEICSFTAAAQQVLHKAVQQESFSPRAVSSCLKVARTIADMAGSPIIGEEAMAEAVAFRRNEGGMEMCF